LSNFNFCPLAWHFCNKSNTSKLEKIQERALRFIYEDYESTYDELLEKAKVPSLKVRRMRTMAIECFKILNKLSPSCLHDLVVFKDCKYNFRYSNNESGRFGALKSDSTHHFFRNACTKSGSLRFSQFSGC
jgi:hypothetical protein